jgi:hypothetical protein
VSLPEETDILHQSWTDDVQILETCNQPTWTIIQQCSNIRKGKYVNQTCEDETKAQAIQGKAEKTLYIKVNNIKKLLSRKTSWVPDDGSKTST